MSTTQPKISLSLDINMINESHLANQSESIKEEKRGFFSMSLAGHKRKASEAFSQDESLSDNAN